MEYFSYLCKKYLIMIIERTADEFVIRVPFTANMERMQDMIDYLRYKELTATYSVSQPEVDNLAREINRNWWKQHAAEIEK
jgi:adenosine deaminase